ncbi:MAG: LysR family transcriptional regulator [Burkholderiales bacterium]|nr:LysR family transcriptional regulator [Burkholderiales bacterium]
MTTATDPARLASRLRFRHLQLLLQLERGGSLRAAAQALHLTQPALSKALAEIESAFGCTLFERTPRGLSPTGRGQVALRGAALLLQELAHVQREVTAEAAAVLRVGAPPFVAHGYLPKVFARLLALQPGVQVELMEERVPLILQALVDGRLDALVTSYPAVMPETQGVKLRFENLFDANFAIIAPPDHPLARGRPVRWAALAREDWIMPAPSAMVRRVLDDTFRREGCEPPVPRVESTSPITNQHLVAAGIGLSVVPASSVGTALKLKLVARVAASPPLAAGPVALVSRAEPANARVDLLRRALGNTDGRA